jgi:hypothetical protein
MRDAARDQFRELQDNASKLKEALKGDGFDALHRDRELVARNFDFLQENRDDASRVWENAGGRGRGCCASRVSSTVHLVEQQIATIENTMRCWTIQRSEG